MDLSVIQGITLGVACLITVLGIYALATNRLPRVPFLRLDRYEPRRYGWGALLIAAFGFTSVLGRDVMEPGSGMDLVLLILPFVFLVSGIGLVMLSMKRSS